MWESCYKAERVVFGLGSGFRSSAFLDSRFGFATVFRPSCLGYSFLEDCWAACSLNRKRETLYPKPDTLKNPKPKTPNPSTLDPKP